ncbi:MAG: hypothetical protein LBL45_13135, partial [Treponema sp.]|nr:hypothetical protein [Treponema sp.]
MANINKIFIPLFLLGSFALFAQTAAQQTSNASRIDEQRGLFPNILFADKFLAERDRQNRKPYGVNTQADMEASKPIMPDQRSLLLNNDILAY